MQTVFDVGANVGQTAIDFSTAFPDAEIHCFEPFGEAFQTLKKTVANLPNVKAVEIAFGAHAGRQVLCLNVESVTNSLLPNAPEANDFQPPGWAVAKGSTDIEVSTVDKYCDENRVHFIDLLKTDTQGYDLNVLRGAEQVVSCGKVAAILAEVLFTPLYAGQAYFPEIYDYLLERDFRLVNLYGVGPNAKKYVSWCDALFVQPDVLAERLAETKRIDAFHGKPGT